ncbi:MAG: hypothetical protein CBD18_02325 [Opitutales bacterium TMED158]|nr:MAG: hypothetical protein CBD18_02325 [Opitutales bacterium TMED158]|tara:strand:+ start:918 stop:1232 length:315 start_codon:yes stop_codon:yes gene_type:complete
MTEKQEQFLAALERSLGVVTTASKATGIGRVSHYRWMKDEKYKRRVQEITESAIDFGESHLHKLIQDGNPAATIFFLKTKGKGRGYVERQEVETVQKKPLTWFE